MRRVLSVTAFLVLLASALLARPAQPDLGSVSPNDRRLIERACEVERGSDSYDACLSGELEALKHVKIPDLAALAPDERQLLEKACGLEHEREGPASYYDCANRFLGVLKDSFGDLGAAQKAARVPNGPPPPRRTDADRAALARPAGPRPRPSHSPPPAAPPAVPEGGTQIPVGDVLLVVVGVACVAVVLLMRFNRETCDECGSATKLDSEGLCARCAKKGSA